MFYDLGLLGDDAEAFVHRERLATALRLGYDCVATSHQAVERLTDRDRCAQRPLDAETLAAAGPGAAAALRAQQGLRREAPGLLRQLSRLTVASEEPAAAAQLLGPGGSPVAASYDLLAVQPLSERVLQQACASLSVDLISLDLGRRLPFRLRPGPLQAAVRRGVHFELGYAAALRDEAARRNFFANATALCRATRGQGIVLSSGARSAFDLRGPYDVANLGCLMGLTEQQAKAAVSQRCLDVIRHAERRRAHKSTLTVLDVPATADDDRGENAAMEVEYSAAAEQQASRRRTR